MKTLVKVLLGVVAVIALGLGGLSVVARMSDGPLGPAPEPHGSPYTTVVCSFPVAT